MRFEWDERKAEINLHKHGVSFPEASSAFGDWQGLETEDRVHSSDEPRFILVGRSRLGRLLVVVHTERGETVRLISARRATWRERLTYEGR
jgi:uncharacterized DUF497 family protein